ncbi:hypothetical protein [Curtobacterium sp. USHLN213]|uniref:hypothetical protein n=1 Tax=Curtobacterium sp. USHLN213 TaxID=3081255 RepID=UPI00301B31E5
MKEKTHDATPLDLIEQWDFMQTSMAAFDHGREHEAKRIAVAIRVLLYEHGGTSVLKQIGVKDSIQYLSSGSVDPSTFFSSPALTSYGPSPDPAGGLAYFPKTRDAIESRSHRWVTFETWWNEPVIKVQDDVLFSRQDLVLMLANRAGGAHVGRLSNAERKLADGSESGWEVFTENGSVPFDANVVPPSMRTIATELDITFDKQRVALKLPSVVAYFMKTPTNHLPQSAG